MLAWKKNLSPDKSWFCYILVSPPALLLIGGASSSFCDWFSYLLAITVAKRNISNMTKSFENFNSTLRLILTKTGWVIKFGPNSVTCLDFALFVLLTSWGFALFRLLASALQVQCGVLSKYSQFLSNAPDLPPGECLTQNASQPFINKKNKSTWLCQCWKKVRQEPWAKSL